MRAFLQQRVLRWQSLPYDWLSLEPEDLDDLNIIDIPEEILDAYQDTRNNLADRARDENSYGRFTSAEEGMKASIEMRRAKNLPLIPEFDNIDSWPDDWRTDYEAYRRQVQDFIDAEADANALLKAG